MKLQFVEAGEIVTTHGVRGEMKVLPWVDGPEILCEFDRVRIAGREYNVESCRIQKSCNLLKVEGIDTMEAAQAMRGKTVELYREDIDDEVIRVFIINHATLIRHPVTLFFYIRQQAFHRHRIHTLHILKVSSFHSLIVILNRHRICHIIR